MDIQSLDKLEKVLSFKEALVYGVEQKIGQKTIGMSTLGLGEAIGGLRKDDFVVVTARGGTGKTYLLMQITYDFAVDKFPTTCGFFSGEMSVDDLAESRLMALHEGVRDVPINATPSVKLERIQQIGEVPIFFPVIEERWSFRSRCMPLMDRMREDLGVNLFVFDHLRYFWNEDQGLRGDERQLIEQTVLDMRLYAKKNKTPIFLAVQPKQLTGDEEVTSDSLKGTSAISQDASVTLVLDRPRLKGKEREAAGKVYAEYVNLKVEKARHGRGNKLIKLVLKPEIGRFIEDDQEQLSTSYPPVDNSPF